MIIRSIAAFLLYLGVYGAVTHYAYILIYEIPPSADYMAIAIIFMAAPLYLIVLGIVALLKPYQPALLAALLGAPGLYCLAILEQDPLKEVKLPQQVPFNFENSSNVFAFIASFFIAIAARQLFWYVTDGLSNYFKRNVN